MSEQRLVYELLFHVYTYALTTVRVVAKLFGLSLDDALELLEQLVQERRLAKAELTPQEDYYHLQPLAAELLRVGSVNSQPINGTPKVVAYATCSFVVFVNRIGRRFRTRCSSLALVRHV